MFNKILQNTRKPIGTGGKMILTMMNTAHARLASWGLTHIDPKTNDYILDIGCGGGANIAALLEKAPQGFVAGIDYSDESVKFSIKKNKMNVGINCEIKKANVSSIPYKDETFDIITAFETIYFWPNLRQNFQEVRRVLKPGGEFLICCEAGDPRNDIWSDRIDGMRVYSITQLKNLLKESGFTIEKADNKENTNWICVVGKRK